jgi:hypothetical protein
MDKDSIKEKDKAMSDDRPERVPLKDALEFTIRAAITDASVFNHYILKEYAPRCQGPLAISKSPAKHTLENCVYDEICGWLDAPSITGISILDIHVGPPAFRNEILSSDPKVHFREIVDLMYDMCKLQVSAKQQGSNVLVDKIRLEQLKERCKTILKNVDRIEFNGTEPQKTSRQVGSGLRTKGVPSGLPSAS